MSAGPAHEIEARRLYEQARFDRTAWIPWPRLSATTKARWTEAIFLAAEEATTALPQSGAGQRSPARTARSGAIPAGDPAGVLVASLGIPAT